MDLNECEYCVNTYESDRLHCSPECASASAVGPKICEYCYMRPRLPGSDGCSNYCASRKAEINAN